MKKSIRQQLENRKRRIKRRLDRKNILVETQQPVFSAAGIQYEVAERTRGLAAGGIGGMQMVAQSARLAENIDQRVHVLKRHLPYHESDHVHPPHQKVFRNQPNARGGFLSVNSRTLKTVTPLAPKQACLSE